MLKSFVNIGDKIFIGGLTGNAFMDYNQKQATIKSIVKLSAGDRVEKIAKVDFENNSNAEINLAYIFNVNEKPYFSDIDDDELGFMFPTYLIHHKIKTYTFFYDEDGVCNLFGKTENDTLEVLTLTSLN